MMLDNGTFRPSEILQRVDSCGSFIDFSKSAHIDFVIPISSEIRLIDLLFMWDGTEEGLTKKTWACVKDCTNCGYCTKMIQLNGWKIPKNYPW